MDVIGRKLFGSVSYLSVPVFDIDFSWKKKIPQHSVYKTKALIGTPDIIKSLVDTDWFDCRFRKPCSDNLLPTYDVHDDKETSTDPIQIESDKAKQIFELSNHYKEIKMKEFTKEKDRKAFLRQGSEYSLEMMTKEYIRVTAEALKAKYSHDIKVLRDKFAQTVNEKIRDSKNISKKLEQVETERDTCTKQLSYLSIEIENNKKTIKTLSDERNMMRTQFDTQCSEMEMEKNQLIVGAARLDSLFTLANKNYCEKLQEKEDALRGLADIIKSQNESKLILSSEKKAVQDDLKDTIEKLATLKCCAQETELKLRNDIDQLLSSLQKDKDTAKDNERIIEELRNRNIILEHELEEALSETKNHKDEASTLRKDIDALILIKNNLDKRFETQSNPLIIKSKFVNSHQNTTKVFKNENKDEDSLEILKEKLQTLTNDLEKEYKNSLELRNELDSLKNNVEQEHRQFMKSLGDEKKVLQEELENSQSNLQKQTNTVLETNCDDDTSNVSDEVRVELAALRREKTVEKLRKTFEQEKQQLQTSIKLEKQKNKQILESMERVVRSCEKKIFQAQALIREEKMKNKELVKLLTSAGIFVGEQRVAMLGQGDYSPQC